MCVDVRSAEKGVNVKNALMQEMRLFKYAL